MVNEPRGAAPRVSLGLRRALLGAVALLSAVGAVIAGVAYQRRAPYPAVHLNEVWGDDRLLALREESVGFCGTGASERHTSPPRPEALIPPNPTVPPPSTPAAVLTMLEGQLEGSLPKTEYCVRAGAYTASRPDGWWTFHFTVLPDGAVTQVSVLGDSQQDPRFERCLASVASGWTFRPIKKPQPVTFSLPFGKAAVSPTPPPLTSPAEIDQMIKLTLTRREDRLQGCFEQALAMGQEGWGPSTLTFTVNPDGTIADAHLAGDLSRFTSLEGCVLREAGRITFQPIHKAQTVIVRLPLDSDD